MKLQSEMGGFRWPKSIQSVELSSISWFWVIHKNNEKTMPKGSSKIMFFWSKWRHGSPRFDLSSDSCRFGAMPKNHGFFKPSRSAKKSSHGGEKVAPGFNESGDSAKMVPTNEKKDRFSRREEVITHASRAQGPANFNLSMAGWRFPNLGSRK